MPFVPKSINPSTEPTRNAPKRNAALLRGCFDETLRIPLWVRESLSKDVQAGAFGIIAHRWLISLNRLLTAQPTLFRVFSKRNHPEGNFF